MATKHVQPRKNATKPTAGKAPKKLSVGESFLSYNRAQSEKFKAETHERRLFREQYPVQVAVMKCMDGRLNVARITGLPVGIMQPYRNLGGIFDLGGHFGEVFNEWVEHAIKKDGRPCLVLVTYHWSRGAKHRGCKGFGYEVENARKYTAGQLDAISGIYGANRTAVYPIQVGIETDEDALVIHGSNGQALDLSVAGSINSGSLRLKLEILFPKMPDVIMASLVNICMGNIKHIAELRKISRPIIGLDHTENILAVGRGFDWFLEPNRMLIVGPYSFNMAAPILTQADIILSNIKEGRISPKDGCALITSVPYRDEGILPLRTKKAQSLMKLVLETLEGHPLMKYVTVKMAGVVDERTRLFTPVKF